MQLSNVGLELCTVYMLCVLSIYIRLNCGDKGAWQDNRNIATEYTLAPPKPTSWWECWESKDNCVYICCVCEASHWLCSGKIQVLLVCRVDPVEVVTHFANRMVTIFLAGCPFNLGFKILLINFFVKTHCTFTKCSSLPLPSIPFFFKPGEISKLFLLKRLQ